MKRRTATLATTSVSRMLRAVSGRRSCGGRADLEASKQLRAADLLSPVATIRSSPSGRGRCSFSASSASAPSQASTSAGVVRITGIAFGWIGATIALASVVRNPNSSCCPSTGALRPSDAAPGRGPRKRRSACPQLARTKWASCVVWCPRTRKTRSPERCSEFLGPSHARQFGLETFRMFVIGWPPNWGGPGIPKHFHELARTIGTYADDRRHLKRGRRLEIAAGCRCGRAWRGPSRRVSISSHSDQHVLNCTAEAPVHLARIGVHCAEIAREVGENVDRVVANSKQPRLRVMRVGGQNWPSVSARDHTARRLALSSFQALSHLANNDPLTILD